MRMNIDLKDNSLVPEKFKMRCNDIQRLVQEGRCSLIDLLDAAGKKARDIPQIFKQDADGALWTGNLVGVFEYRAGDGSVEQVVIGDRFGPREAANGGANGEFLSTFVWAMLEQCWDDTPLWLLNEFRSSGETTIFDQILMLQLASALERAWKKGQLRLYRTVSYYDCRVRGQLDLPRKIRMSMGLDDGRMAYRVREYSEDNIYNHLFFQACLEAERRQPKLMRRLRQTMPGCRMARQALERQNAGWSRSDTRSLLNGTRKKITNPIYRDYETLRGTARAVLKRSSHSSYPYAESGAPFVTGIFLDISKLWEDYLYKAVFPIKPKAQLPVQTLTGIPDIRPDFWWEDKKRVLDAKFRRSWGEFLNNTSNTAMYEKIRDNEYQVLFYMLVLDCTRGGVIFPTKSVYTEWKQEISEKSKREFWAIPFTVPQSEEYKDFCKDMETEVKKVRGKVAAFLS